MTNSNSQSNRLKKELQKLPGTPEPSHRWRNAQGGVIAGDCYGNPANPAVFFLHGGGQTRHAWQNCAVALAENGCFSVALDMRGHGDSSWANEDEYRYQDMCHDLAVVCAELSVDKPILVGASMGGLVSLLSIGTKAVNAGALVLVDIVPALNREGSQQVLDFMLQGSGGFDSLDEIAESIAAYQPHRKRQKNLPGLAKNVRLGSDGRYYWHWDPDMFRGWNDRAVGDLDGLLQQSARELEVPVLLVRGGLSNVVLEQDAQEFLRLCPHAEHVNIADAAHMVAGDRNDVFSEAIISFVARNVR